MCVWYAIGFYVFPL